MSKITVVFKDYDYRGEPYITLRGKERRQFAPGGEVEVAFVGRNPQEGFGMARTAAMAYAGILSAAGRLDTIPFVSELGPYSGRVVGSQTSGGAQGWRIDWEDGPKGFHINWWDRRLNVAGRRDRSKWYYGANTIAGGSLALFWEVESHFPGRV